MNWIKKSDKFAVRTLHDVHSKKHGGHAVTMNDDNDDNDTADTHIQRDISHRLRVEDETLD